MKLTWPTNPNEWHLSDHSDFPESDDELYISEKGKTYPPGRKNVILSRLSSMRGLRNAGCLFILIAGIICLLFVCNLLFNNLFLTFRPSIVYPVVTFVKRTKDNYNGGYNIGGINASGQIPTLTGNWGLIDSDTPKDAYTLPSWADGKTELQLVFSDEFNVDGRTFYPGDDPYWEAENLHYWVHSAINAGS